jgi:hypothetical protein
MKRLPMINGRPVRRTKNPNSLVVYQGPSAIDGTPIVAILSGLADASDNAKTGPMVHLWILADNGETPNDAQKSGGDSSVCGDCPLRPLAVKDARKRGTGYGTRKGERQCYVKTFQAPRAVYSAYKRGNIPADLARAIKLSRGRALRLGAYGDPAAIPESAGVVQRLCKVARSVTGYSHQWRDPRHAWLQVHAMASVETELDAWQAWKAGWRTFRVSSQPMRALARVETPCPAYTHGVTCADCMLCGGASVQARSIWIQAH